MKGWREERERGREREFCFHYFVPEMSIRYASEDVSGEESACQCRRHRFNP